MLRRTRFAPSPTGDLHLGSAATALACQAFRDHTGARLILRIEDLDQPRVVPGAAKECEADLDWLGITFDEGPSEGGGYGPYVQTERIALYDDALHALEAKGLVYPCDCSRQDIARAASAPHEGEEQVYPGTCRDKPRERRFRRPPSLRLRVPHGIVVARDGISGDHSQDVSTAVGDFVLRRADGIYSYQLAVVVDDARMGMTDVVRGADLLSSAPRQALLAMLLDWTPPTYWHVPLVLAEDGTRLAKRNPRHTLRGLRAAGVNPASVRAFFYDALGLTGPPTNWRRTPLRLPSRHFDERPR